MGRASACIYGMQGRTRPPYVHTFQQTHTLDARTLTQQLRHRNTLTHNWAQAELRIRKCLLEAFLIKPRSAPKYLAPITLHFPAMA